MYHGFSYTIFQSYLTLHQTVLQIFSPSVDCLCLFIASFVVQEHYSLMESQVYIGHFFLPCLWLRKPLH